MARTDIDFAWNADDIARILANNYRTEGARVRETGEALNGMLKELYGNAVDARRAVNVAADFENSPDPSPGIDNTSAFLKAAEAAKEWGVPIYVPGGTWEIDSFVSEETPVTIVGDGSNLTKIVGTTTESGGWVIDLSAAGAAGLFKLIGLRVEAKSEGLIGAVRVRNTGTPPVDPNLIIDDLVIDASGDLSMWPLYGLYTEDLFGVRIGRMYIGGGYLGGVLAPTVYGWQARGDYTDYVIHDLFVTNVTQAVDIGGTIEGVVFHHLECFATQKGLLKSHDATGEPMLYVHSGLFDVEEEGVNIKNVRRASIRDVLMFTRPGDQAWLGFKARGSLGVDILLDHVSFVGIPTLGGNDYHTGHRQATDIDEVKHFKARDCYMEEMDDGWVFGSGMDVTSSITNTGYENVTAPFADDSSAVRKIDEPEEEEP